MKSTKIIINNNGENFSAALDLAEKYSRQMNLGKKTTMHIRLLTEETMSMVAAMTGEFTAYFWLEGEPGHHTIRLDGNVKLDSYERENLLNVAKSGGNILAKGVMGKIKNLIEIGTLNYKELGKNTILDYGVVMPTDPDAMISPGMTLGMTEQFWSLQSYKKGVKDAKTVHDDPEEVRNLVDELERSIVAKLADDVQIGILDGKFKMIVSYKEME